MNSEFPGERATPAILLSKQDVTGLPKNIIFAVVNPAYLAVNFIFRGTSLFYIILGDKIMGV